MPLLGAVSMDNALFFTAVFVCRNLFLILMWKHEDFVSFGSETVFDCAADVVVSAQVSAAVDAFDLRVRLAGGDVAPLRPWVGDGAKWVKSAIWAQSASRNA